MSASQKAGENGALARWQAVHLLGVSGHGVALHESLVIQVFLDGRDGAAHAGVVRGQESDGGMRGEASGLVRIGWLRRNGCACIEIDDAGLGGPIPDETNVRAVRPRLTGRVAHR